MSRTTAVESRRRISQTIPAPKKITQKNSAWETG
jgi:hypothetical protein